jgi:predicted HNH restriction endonuclease
MKSYTTIEGEIEVTLEQSISGYQSAFTEPLSEGSPALANVTVYERNPAARRKCIERYGSDCYACGFSFGDRYGEIAEGYIHVHHLRPLAITGVKHTVDPIRDLRPICPNCHAVAHLTSPPWSIAKLKRMIKENER